MSNIELVNEIMGLNLTLSQAVRHAVFIGASQDGIRAVQEAYDILFRETEGMH